MRFMLVEANAAAANVFASKLKSVLRVGSSKNNRLCSVTWYVISLTYPVRE